MRWSVKMLNKKSDDMRKILRAPWSWQDFKEFMSANSDTLWQTSNYNWVEQMIGSSTNDIIWNEIGMTQTGWIKLFRRDQTVSPVEAKEDRNEKRSFQQLMKLRRWIIIERREIGLRRIRAKMVCWSILKSKSSKVERSVRNFEHCIRRNCVRLWFCVNGSGRPMRRKLSKF